MIGNRLRLAKESFEVYARTFDKAEQQLFGTASPDVGWGGIAMPKERFAKEYRVR